MAKAKTTSKKKAVEEVKAAAGACPYECPGFTLKPTMEGKDILWLQWNLNKCGYGLKLDGIFRGKTLEAVKDFQENNGLEVTGVADQKTKAALRLK